ncbi:2348572a-005e-4ab1-82c7-62ebcb3e5d99 [Thermothielavioides terrestris]|uniref:2348572a-005e-4ab1-82c7-62ebcb3e5d99 n=1 Tax=Thermothielavioides terrestris TaxID=2587410 RepID=A0A3S4BB99_9PEZI|nr:2348572a-005e-4ab1-82c7-62ebcb3e5d99 [Thermothielavioides terrestris]
MFPFPKRATTGAAVVAG